MITVFCKDFYWEDRQPILWSLNLTMLQTNLNIITNFLIIVNIKTCQCRFRLIKWFCISQLSCALQSQEVMLMWEIAMNLIMFWSVQSMKKRMDRWDEGDKEQKAHTKPLHALCYNSHLTKSRVRNNPKKLWENSQECVFTCRIPIYKPMLATYPFKRNQSNRHKISGKLGLDIFSEFAFFHMKNAAGVCPSQTRSQQREQFLGHSGEGWRLGGATNASRYYIAVF